MNRSNSAALHTDTIKRLSAELGFDHCGIAKARMLDEDARRLEQWLTKGMHGDMGYMERNFDLRVDPTKLVPGARSVVTLLVNHFPAETQRHDGPKIARYAYGQDYHEVIRSKLKELLKRLSVTTGPLQARGFVDSAPVLERSWAVRSGLGWVGKNGNLISRKGGSYFFIAVLILDLDLVYDDPFPTDHCGTCTRCVDNCPTDAILPNKVVDGSRCISYFTIELKELIIPEEMKGRFGDWAFGCDICQEVCPWNRFAEPTKMEAFDPIREVMEFSYSDWEALTEDAFKITFRHSPIKRAGFKGIQRNLRFIRKEES